MPLLPFKGDLLNSNKEAPVHTHAGLQVCVSVSVYRCVCQIGERGDALMKASLRFPWQSILNDVKCTLPQPEIPLFTPHCFTPCLEGGGKVCEMYGKRGLREG